MIVKGLPEKYKEFGIVRDLLKDVDNEDVTVEDLKETIDVEWKDNFKGTKPKGDKKLSAYNTTAREGDKNKMKCPHCGKTGHSPDKCFKKNPKLLEEYRKNIVKNVKCHECGETGHYKKDCPKLKKKDDDNNNNNNNDKDKREVSFCGCSKIKGVISEGIFLGFAPTENDSENERDNENEQSEVTEGVCEEEKEEPRTNEIVESEMNAEVYATDDQDNWMNDGRKKEGLPIDMLADSGANTHVFVSDEGLQNGMTWEQDINVGGRQVVRSNQRGDKAFETSDGVIIGMLNGLVCANFGKNIMSITAFTNKGAMFTIQGEHACLQMGDASVGMI